MKKYLILAMLVSSTAAHASGSHVYTEYATVVDSQPIYTETPSREVCTETRQEVISRSTNERGYTGPIIGGIAGGLLGRTVGKGSGKDAATAVGAIAGAIVGDRIGNNKQNSSVEYSQPTRTCRFIPGERTVVGYDVVARYNGSTFRFESKNYVSTGTDIPVNVSISLPSEYSNVEYRDNRDRRFR